MKDLSIKIILILSLSMGFPLKAQVFPPDEQNDLKEERNGRFVLDSTYIYQWEVINQNWLNDERTRVLQRDSHGNPLRWLTITWNPVINQWEDEKKREQFYYDSLHPHYIEGFVWDSRAGEWKMSDSIFYRLDGNPAVSWFKVWDKSKFRFSRGKKVNYHYNPSGLKTQEDIQVFDTISGNWATDQEVTWQYNDDGLLLMQQTKVWRNQGIWMDTLRLTYTYNELNQPVSRILETWNPSGFWENTQRIDQTFDTSGNLTEVFQYAWNEQEQQWVTQYRQFYTYNEQLRLTERLQQYWESDFSTWINLDLTIYQYNSMGLRTNIVQQFWDAFGYYWYNTANYVYTYDGDGNRLEFIFQFWDEESSEWINIYKDLNWWSFFEPSAVNDSEIAAANVFPNPASGLINVKIQGLIGGGYLEIFNLSGQLVYSAPLENESTPIDVSSFARGTHFLRITLNNRILTSKVVIY